MYLIFTYLPLVAGGGHAFAGGLTIKASEFENFKKDFEKICKEHQFIKENKEYTIVLK